MAGLFPIKSSSGWEQPRDKTIQTLIVNPEDSDLFSNAFLTENASARQKNIQKERRTLKNWGYAAKCQVKREDEEEDIKRDIQIIEYYLEENVPLVENSLEIKQLINNHRSGGVFGSYQHADQVQRLRKLK